MRRLRQPQHGLTINPLNPFTRGASLLVAGSTGFMNLATGRKADVQVGSVSRLPGKLGMTDNAYSAGVFNGADAFSLPSLTDFAVVALVDYSNPLSSGYVRSIFGGDQTGNRQFQFRFSASNQLEFIRFNTSGSAFTASVAATARSGVVIGISIGTSVKVWFAGATGTATITGTPMAASRVAIGGSFGIDSEQGVTDLLYMGAVLNGSVVNGGLASLASNPWQLFAPRRVRFAVASSGGGGSGGLLPKLMHYMG